MLLYVNRKSRDDFKKAEDRQVITDWMTEGAGLKALQLLSEKKLDGIVAMGGATLALLGSRVMSRLPFGIPKVIGTTAAMPAYVGKWFGANDITVMQLIMEIAGKNDLVGNAISQVAGAISGMTEMAVDPDMLKLPGYAVAITQIGFSDQCAKKVEKRLEEKGYEVFPFHAQGVSDRALDKLIAQGFFEGIVEIVPAGLVEEKFHGNRAAGMERLDAALERGIPQVWAPCCLNLTGVGPTRINREKYLRSGKMFPIDAIRTMTRFPEDELLECARLYAGKMNRAKGPLKMVIPTKGWSSIDGEGSVLFDPDQDRIFVTELMRHLDSRIETEEVDCNLEDDLFAKVLVENFDRLMSSNKAA